MSTGQEVQAFSLCCAKVRGKKQNAFYPDERPVHTLDDLLKIAQLDHTPGFFKDAHRGKLSWYWQECIVLDVDNTDGGKVTNPADIARDFPGVGHYIIYSRHHNKPKVKDDGKGEYPAAPRFHVYFPINSQFTGAKIDAFIKKAIASQPYFDPCCDGRARFIFGVENPQGETVPGALTLDDFLAQQAAPVATSPAVLPVSSGMERIIPAGERHSHMVKVATQVLTRCGPDGVEQAREAYDREAEHLESGFPQTELERIDHLLKEAAVHLEVDADALDADPAKLNTPAGVIDLRTGVIQPSDPAERCTKITSVAPSDTGADIWQDFLAQITCGDADMARYLQELAGMAAYGKQVNEGIVMAVGDGGNGKSTLFNVLARVLGDYAGSINPKILLASRGKSYDAETVELRGLRLAIAAETEEGARLDSAAVKQLGSQDKISARPLYGKPIAFWPSHTLVLFTNFLPKVGSRDDGTWSRLKIAPFKAKLRGAKGEVKDFASYLYDNAGGAVLSWIIEGAQRFIANGFKIEPPEAARAALAEYSRENDWLQDFIEDCCCIGPSHTAGSQELYTMYAMHCQATGAGYKRDAREFRQALTAAGYESRRQNKGVRFYGLGLKSAAAPDV